METWFRLYSALSPSMKLLTKLRVMVKALLFLCCRGMLCVEAPITTHVDCEGTLGCGRLLGITDWSKEQRGH